MGSILLYCSLNVSEPHYLVLLLDHASRSQPWQEICLEHHPFVEHSDPALDHLGCVIHSDVYLELLDYLL